MLNILLNYEVSRDVPPLLLVQATGHVLYGLSLTVVKSDLYVRFIWGSIPLIAALEHMQP